MTLTSIVQCLKEDFFKFQALNVYWFTNNLFTIAQQRLLSSKFGRNIFGIPEQRKDIAMKDPLERIQNREKLRQEKMKLRKLK